MLDIEKTKFIITSIESSWLVFTSMFNFLPIFFALSKNLLFYGAVSFGTGFFSVMYWWYPIHGLRRTLDLYYAKMSFFIYLGSGMYYIPYGVPSTILYIGAFSIFLLYAMTYVFPHIWLRFHILFHLVSIAMKLYILFYVEHNVDKALLYDII